MDAGDVDMNNVQYSGASNEPEELWRTADVCAQVAEKGSEYLEAGYCPVYLGGDHSLSVGSLLAAQTLSEVGVLWVDAHADFNTPETSPSGNFHGMPLATALGRGEHSYWGQALGVLERNTVVVGVRDVDPGEQELLNQSAVTVFTMDDVSDRGLKHVLYDAVEIATAGVDALHLSFDLDVFDPSVAPGVSTPVEGGFSAIDGLELCRELGLMHKTGGVLRSVDIVELNPEADVDNKTAELAVACLDRLFT
jgi:arginase